MIAELAPEAQRRQKVLMRNHRSPIGFQYTRASNGNATQVRRHVMLAGEHRCLSQPLLRQAILLLHQVDVREQEQGEDDPDRVTTPTVHFITLQRVLDGSGVFRLKTYSRL